MLVTIWNGKTYDSINDAEKALESLLRDNVDSLFHIIKEYDKDAITMDHLLELIDNTSSTSKDLKKLRECKKWIKD